MTNARIGALLALAAAVSTSACKSESAAPRPRLQVYGRDIGSDWANVSVLLDGAPVEDAEVVVNGDALPIHGPEAGMYSGPLAVLRPGDPVSLRVTSGDLAVTATGELPQKPLIVAAYTSAAIATDGDIHVTWRSPSDPDEFAVFATWPCGVGCGAGKSFTAPGSARALTIPAGALPPGIGVDVAVFAYEDGAFAGDYAPYADYPGMNIRAESGSLAVATGLTAPPPATLEVYGRDIVASGANVLVTQHGQGIEGAVVVVNGIQLLPAAVEAGRYEASFPAPPSAGDPISLEVTWGGLRVTGLGALPDAPVLTSPGDGAAFATSEDLVVTWTSPTDPDVFEVAVSWPCGPTCMTGRSFEAAGSARTLAIPAASLPTGAIGVAVFAYDDGALSGDYTPWLPYPGMNIRAYSGSVTVTRN